MSQGYEYTASKSTTLGGAAEVITIQQPATAARNVTFQSADIAAVDAAVTLTVERDGTAATATALTPAGATANTPAPTAKAWSGSDAGAGTVLERILIPSGTVRELDLSKYAMYGGGTGKNFTLRTASMTGTVIFTIRWAETLP